ncbi:MAG TPA: hypothetical protein VKV33_09505 [Streptosporangiaceae bacterium]|nr:hypothetical protein [Streptosporangiaceae bacterium]
MPDKVLYYAIIDDTSSRDRPLGVFRRTYTAAGGLRDEVFGRPLQWERSSLLFSAERGDLQYKFVEISEAEANQIIDRIRAERAGAPDP